MRHVKMPNVPMTSKVVFRVSKQWKSSLILSLTLILNIIINHLFTGRKENSIFCDPESGDVI